jgi:hypothetical protein
MGVAKPAFPSLCRGHPLAAGLVGAYCLHEGSGTIINDLSGGNNNGTLQGASWSTGPSGYSLKLVRASAQYVNVPALIQAPTSTVTATMACWVNPLSLGGYYGIMETRIASPATFIALLLSGSPGNPVTASWNNTGAEYDAASGLTLNIGEWAFVAVTVAGTSLTVYRISPTLGLRAFSITLSSTARDLSKTWVFGQDTAVTGRSWNGQMDGFLIYGRSLSAFEISLLYEDSFQMYRRRRPVLVPSVVGPPPIVTTWPAAILGHL